jgi:poly(3-hydroxybutyrate) depolymerase
MSQKSLIKLCLAAVSVAALSGCVTTPASPLTFAGAPCNTPPVMRCPDKDCGALVVEQGPVQGPAPDRRYFLDYPCDLKQGEKVTVVLNLHGGGSYGNWQRHYFPVVDYADDYRLVVITPNAPPRAWSAAADDTYLQALVTNAIDTIGAKNVKSFWLAGHSQGGMTSRRIVCSDFFKDKVDGFLSLSGGRVGGQPSRSPAGFGPAPQAGAPAAAPRPTPAAPAGGAAPPAAAAPTCDFSHIYTTGEHEIGALPETSDWAVKFDCGPRVRREDVVDTKAGYIYDTSRQNPPTKGWGRPAAPGKAEVFEYTNCKDGRVVADVVRIDKGHTEGLEPKVTETLVKMITKASGGKIAKAAS